MADLSAVLARPSAPSGVTANSLGRKAFFSEEKKQKTFISSQLNGPR
jgi:hypothetical protein